MYKSTQFKTRLVLNFLTVVISAAIPSMAHAQSPRADGPSGSGGGDLCESRIQEIRDDILSWVSGKGPQKSNLILPAGMEMATYIQGMSEVLSAKKDAGGVFHEHTNIECVHAPLNVDGYEKVCRFEDGPTPKITCFYEAFMDHQTMSEEKQYELIHHEYAGLAMLESPDGSQSHYAISSQISARLREQVIKRLAIDPPDLGLPAGANSAFHIDWNARGTRLIFKFCNRATGCETLGNPDGYDPQELYFHPLLRKGYSVAVGAVDTVGAVAVVVVAWFVTVSTGGADILTGIGTATATLNGGGTLLVGEGSIYLSRSINAMNPSRQWKRANLSSVMEDAHNHHSVIVVVDDRDAAQKKSIILDILHSLPSNETHPAY